MRYLKTFENAENENIDKDYIEECFIDVGSTMGITIHESKDRFFIEIKEKAHNTFQDFYVHKKDIETHMELLDDIENALKKVKIRYNNARQKIMYTNFSIFITILLGKGDEYDDDFHEIKE